MATLITDQRPVPLVAMGSAGRRAASVGSRYHRLTCPCAGERRLWSHLRSHRDKRGSRVRFGVLLKLHRKHNVDH